MPLGIATMLKTRFVGVTAGAVNPRMLTWSADSLHLHYCGIEQKVYRVRIIDRYVEEVADLSFVADDWFIRSMGSGYWWYGFDPEGSLITIRPLGTTEIYALDLEAP